MPAGIYEWKVALNDNWDENYGDAWRHNFTLDLAAGRNVTVYL